MGSVHDLQVRKSPIETSGPSAFSRRGHLLIGKKDCIACSVLPVPSSSWGGTLSRPAFGRTARAAVLQPGSCISRIVTAVRRHTAHPAMRSAERLAEVIATES